MTSNYINKKNRPTWLIAICLLNNLILGCKDQQLADDIQVYQQRMASVLESTAPNYTSVHLPPYPTLAELALYDNDTTIKLTDFYELQHCQLATIIAERNTTLGKLQLPSTRFTYEKKLISGLKNCISQTQNDKLKTKLQLWLDIKSKTLSNAWLNMLQSSKEIKQGLSANQGFITGEGYDGLSETLSALTFLAISLQNANLDSTELENHLQAFSQVSLLAKLWRSQLLLTENIKTTTLWLEQQSLGDMCINTNPSLKQKINYLHNVFQLFFIEKIQPIASQMNHYHYQLSPKLDALIQHPGLSKAFVDYITVQQYQNFNHYQTAMALHIEFWQTLFSQCHLKPGKVL